MRDLEPWLALPAVKRSSRFVWRTADLLPPKKKMKSARTATVLIFQHMDNTYL